MLKQFVVGIVSLVWSASVGAETITVCAQGCAYSTVQSAIDGSTDGDVIEVLEGVYPFSSITIDDRSLTLRGQVDSVTGEPVSILDAQGFGSVVHCIGGQEAGIVLENLVFQNGSAAEGAGVRCTNSSPTIINCVFRDNVATGFVRGGGGFSCGPGCAPTLVDCLVTENDAVEDGGGVHCYGASHLTLSNCILSQNSASSDGGGGYASGGAELELNGCLITGNGLTTNDGGGLYCNDFSTLRLNDCVLTGNQASDDGGGLAGDTNSNIELTGCQVRDNIAPSGSGVHVQSGVHLLESVLCGNGSNLADQLSGSYVDLGGNCISVLCDECEPTECPADIDGTGLIDGADLTLLLAQWNCAGGTCSADIDGSGLVDGADLTIILASWGACDA